MAHGKLLKQLIKTGAEDDADAFRRVSQQVIAEERAKNHHLLANDLERILNGRPRQAGPSGISCGSQSVLVRTPS